MALKLNGTNSVAAPAYAGADADTGLQCGTDEVNLVTGGTARLKIESDGDVGIGTTSPASRLHVYHPTVNVNALIESGDANAYIAFKDSSTSSASHVYLGASGNDMQFATGTVERMRITSAGNVGIGTTSTDYELDVRSSDTTTVNINAGTSNLSRLFFSDTTNNLTDFARGFLNYDHSSDSLRIGSAGSERMRIDSSGRLISGTTSAPGTVGGFSHLNIKGTSINANGAIGLYRNTASPSAGQGIGAIYFANSDGNAGAYIQGQSDGTWGTNDYPGRLVFFTTADGASSATERMRIDSDGLVSLSDDLLIPGDSSKIYGNVANGASGPNNSYIEMYSSSNGDMTFATTYSTANFIWKNGTTPTERMRIDSSGALMVGTTTPGIVAGDDLTLSDSENAGITIRSGSSYSGSIYFSDGTSGADEYRGAVQYTHDGNYMRFLTDAAERMRVTNGGTLIIGGTDSALATIGSSFTAAGSADHTRSGGNIVYLNRLTNDGNLIQFYGDTNFEGSISISGSTISYNGGHLTRWSQLTGGAERTEILRGTVLSNLDEMCEWGEEDNEQLNRMKISDVEGDVNVAGVFQAWDDDDDTYTNDFYCAMTGDFVIRIAQGTTIARGDLLMSAGDGTAKPQDDDIVRSKTIAKVTSTTVSTTYSDGSYCVPCVLMAC